MKQLRRHLVLQRFIFYLVLTSAIDDRNIKVQPRQMQGFLHHAAPRFTASPTSAGTSSSQAKPREPIHYYILEKLPVDTPVGNAALDAGLAFRYIKADLDGSVFMLLSQRTSGSTKLELFQINSRSGNVSTSKVIDRDQLCPGKDICLVHLDVLWNVLRNPGGTSSEHFEIIKVVIEIIDINDHSPLFPETEIEIGLSEASPTGSGYNLPLALDEDSHVYGIRGYRIQGEAAGVVFELENEMVDGEIVGLVLRLVTPLDREAVDSYCLELVSFDGGDPARSGTLTVNVAVVDFNDNPPVFDHQLYEISVSEDSTAGMTIGQLGASDRDAGLNAEVCYALSKETEKAHDDKFGIDLTQGGIYLKGTLDFEEQNIYRLVVFATDQGDIPQIGQTTVLVKVLDVNDNAPSVVVKSLTSSGVAEVYESARLGTFVAHLSVEDKDDGENGYVVCQLLTGSDVFTVDRLSSNRYKIVTSCLLDREQVDRYRMLIECRDSGSDVKSTQTEIIVTILDVNDERPTFMKSCYFFHLPENNDPGEVSVTVQATDRDAGLNGQIRYRILDQFGELLFAIHPVKGTITAKVKLDKDNLPVTNFTVEAYDLGDPPLSSRVSVFLTFTGDDHDPPEILQSAYSFGIFENLPAETEVGHLCAVEIETINDVKVRFRLNEPSDLFAIDDVTGRLYTRHMLDRELTEFHFLTVIAQCELDSRVYALANVSVFVLDKNDNAPVIDVTNDELILSNNFPVGRVIGEVTATDLDAGDNSKIIFTLEECGDQMFGINETSGLIFVRNSLLKIDYRKFGLTVTARDQGIPSLATTKMFFVSVNSSYADDVISVANNNAVIGATLMSSVVLLLSVLFLFVVVVKRYYFAHEMRNNGQILRSPPERYPNRFRFLFSRIILQMDDDDKTENYQSDV